MKLELAFKVVILECFGTALGDMRWQLDLPDAMPSTLQEPDLILTER